MKYALNELLTNHEKISWLRSPDNWTHSMIVLLKKKR